MASLAHMDQRNTARLATQDVNRWLLGPHIKAPKATSTSLPYTKISQACIWYDQHEGKLWGKSSSAPNIHRLYIARHKTKEFWHQLVSGCSASVPKGLLLGRAPTGRLVEGSDQGLTIMSHCHLLTIIWSSFETFETIPGDWEYGSRRYQTRSGRRDQEGGGERECEGFPFLWHRQVSLEPGFPRMCWRPTEAHNHLLISCSHQVI